ncbi:hypothetical protein ACF1A5_05565 [Streptomyces sp. NPDC014864]|uniref:hypothetical protein n=1 Tax=Streptomyces sp. NPDC014864 TaxID=3364924 RepID=UPI0036FF4FBB
MAPWIAVRPGAPPSRAFVCPAGPALNGFVAAMASLRDILPAGDFGRPGPPGMFSLAAPDRIHDVLTASGFTEISINRAQTYGTWGHGAEDPARFLLGTGPAAT